MGSHPASASHQGIGPSGLGLTKITLKAREFGKEITNNNVLSSTSAMNSTSFASNQPHTVKNGEASHHHHPHPSTIGGVSVGGMQTRKTINNEQVRGGSSGIPEHLILSHNHGSAIVKPMIVRDPKPYASLPIGNQHRPLRNSKESQSRFDLGLGQASHGASQEDQAQLTASPS